MAKRTNHKASHTSPVKWRSVVLKNSLGFIAFLITFLITLPFVALMGSIFFIAKAAGSKKLSKYAYNSLYGIDQAANTVLAGHPEETISSRLGRARIQGYRFWWVRFLRFVVDVLSYPLDGPDHCVRAAKHEGLKMNLNREIWNWSKEK